MAFRRTRRMVARATAATLLISAVAVGTTVSAPRAVAAAGTVLFSQTFHDNTLDGPAGSLVLPTAPAASGNTACLTAAGNATANPLASCPTSPDGQGAGKLRLTQNIGNQEGGVFASTSVPTSQGLDVTFNSYQYGGTQGADGLAFVLAAVNPANPVTPAAIGQSGGALGYSAPSSNSPGLSYGYLGVGIDVYGNFSNRYEGLGCTDPANMNGPMAGEVAIRGPGNGSTGYCALASSAATATSQKLTLRALARAASVVPVEVVYNPSSLSVTTPSGLVVPGGDYDVHFTPVGGPAKDLVGALPTVPSGLYPSTWVNASGYPKQLAFGWVGSTGSVTDFHEIDDVVVTTLNPVPQLAVSQTSYAAATLTPGSPVTYTVAASSSGAAENQPVTATETLPAGVLPVGASGTGWVCAAPSGQQISCTSSTSPFTAGTITVNAVVKSSSVTPALIQSSTSAVASSSDASPATSSSAPAGTVPATPSVTGVNPSNGASGGGGNVTVTGSNLAGATAIEIGTAAEFAAGTPTTLNLCASAAPGCFVVNSANSLGISSMPAHAAGAVQVSVVSLGIAGTGAYTYNAGPALLFPAPPGGEVNVAYSDQLTVTAGTSPFTWSVSAGTLPAGVTLGASTGLLAGTPTAAGTYTFTVKVTDASLLSATEPVSLTVIAGPSLSLPAPPAGWTHTVYSDTLTESGGTSPFTWSVSSGSLPAGISLSGDGNLTGTPTAIGTTSFTVKVTDANSQSVTQVLSITISAGVSTTFSAPPGAVVGAAYTDTLTATGGTTPYAWSVNAGTLPSGISLSSAGVLSGTPTTAGSYPFTVNVIDANNGIATASITLVVTTTLTLTFGTPPGGVVGTAYTDTLTAAGGTTPYTWSVSAGTLPAGITLNTSSGVLAGTPTAGGTANFTIKVTDATSKTATQATSITVLAGALSIVQSANVATTTPGSTVTYTIKVTNSGQIALTGATFTDPLSGVLDDASYNTNASATAGTVSFGSPNLTWTGNLAIGAVATITYSVTVSNPDTGNDILASTITSTTLGSNCAVGSTDPNCALSVPVSVLTITGTANVSTATPGAVVGYTIAVTNSGQVAYTGAGLTDALSGVLDDATYNLDATATAGSVSFTSPNLTWTGSLAVGATATITFSVTVNSPDTGNKILASTITSTSAGNNCASGSTDARCASSVTVLVPGLTIALTANTASTTPGSVVGYTLTMTNTGQTPYTGATVTDSLAGVVEDAVYNGDAAATAGSVTYASPNLTWTGNLAVGAVATVTFSVTVNNPDTGDKVLASVVTSATPGSNCPAGGTDPRCASSVPDLVPGLTIAASAGSATTTPGAVVHYTVTVTNSGQTAYTGATFTDPLAGVLDDAAYNSDAAATAGTVSYTSPNLTWTGNLAVGAVATITFSVTVNNPDTGNDILASTITSATTGSNCAAGSGAAACTATVDVSVLTITGTASVSTATPGATVSYTVTVTNSGQVAYTGAGVTDALSGVLDDATYNLDATATAGSVSFTSPNLTWTGSLAVGATATITFSVTVNSPDTGNKILASTITSTNAGNNCASGSTDARCASSVTVLVPGLTIAVSAGSGTSTLGAVVHYTIMVTNSGQTAYTGATFTDPLSGLLDDAAYDGDAAATAGAVAYASPALTWTGNLAVGATATITFSVTVNNPDTGDKVLADTVTSAAAGSNCAAGSTDARCSVTVVVLVPGLTIAASAGSGITTPGSVVHYTVTVTNSGQTAYAGAAFTDPLTGVLDDASYDGDAAATAGSVSYASPNLSWTGNLAVGATATITFSVTVNSPDIGNDILASTVTSATGGSNCAAGSTDARCSVTVDVAVLTIVNTSGVATTTPGSVVRFTSTFTNAGQVAYTGITIASNITDVLDDATPNGDQTATSGTLTLTATGISWTGSIPVGGTVTVTGTVTVNNPDTGNKVMASTLATAAAGSNCPAGGTDPRCSVSVTVLVPGLTTTVSAGSGTATPGSMVHYTITVTNSGQTAYTGAAFTDPLSGLLDDASYDNDAAATAGAVTYASPALTWTGNLAPGATATITFSVTVNNPDTGDKVLVDTVTSAAAGSNCAAGSTDARCSVTVTVLVPGLTIAASAGSGTTAPGAVVHYTVTVTNSGQAAYTGAAFTDPLTGVLDDASYDGDAAATAGSVSYASPALSWTGNLAVGATATITFSVTVNHPDTGNDILSSTLTSATGGSNCAAGSTDARCSVTVDVAVLTIVNTSGVATTTPGSVVRFTSTFTNAGQVAYTGITIASNITDVVDDATPDGDQTATSGTLSISGTSLSWTGSIPVGGTVTITGTVTVNNPDTGNKVLATTFTTAAAGSNCPAGGTDPRCSVSVTVLTPGLSIVKTANASSAVPGQVVGYTVTITDTGQTPYAGAVVTDSLAAMANDAVYDGDAAATAGSLTFASPVLTWTGSLAPGAAAVITYSVTVNSPDTGGKLVINSVSSAAAGSSCPLGSVAAGCQVTVPVLTPALAIATAASPATTAPGAVVHYTVTVTNSGQTPYTGATFTDPLTGALDDAAYNGDAAATAGTVSFTSPNLTWAGNLAVGATATITFSVTVSNPDTGNKILSSTVTSTTTGSNCAAGSGAAACTTTVNVAVLAIATTPSAATTTPGAVVRFTTTLTNTGQTPYTGISVAFTGADVANNATSNGDQTASSGNLSVGATGAVWTGDIPVGGTVTITGSLTVDDPDTGDHIIALTDVSTAPGNNCLPGSTDPACSPSVLVLTPALTIVKTANVSSTSPGGVIHYTVKVTDSGQTPYTGATYTDQMDGVLGDATYNNDAAATVGSVSFASPDLTWTGNLAAGASATITYSVTVDNPDDGNQILTNTVVSSTPGSNCPVGGTDPRCTVTVDDLVPGLDIVASADKATATPGTVVHYTITATNTGQTAYTGASFTDPLSGVLDDAAYNGDAAATAGSVTFASPNLTWTGNLAVGAVATITFSVTENNPDTGDKILASTITSATVGNNCPAAGGTDTACTVTVNAVNAATLTFTATADTAAAAAGGVVHYTITVANSGLTPYNGATFTAGLGGVPGNATYDGDAAAATGTVTVTSPTLTWTGNVPASGTVTITYSVTVNRPDTGNHILASTITSTSPGSNCGTGSADPRCTATVDVAALAITATANASTISPGSDVQYTVTATNAGQAAYSDASITFDFSDVFEDASYNGDLAATSGTLVTDAAAGTGTWTGDLNPGATVTITFSVTVIPPDSDLSDRVLALTVDSAALGNNCPAGGTDPGCTAAVTVLVPALTITKTANASAAVPGQVVGYTITITDTGQTPYTGAVVTDSLAAMADDAVYDGDATATAGSLAFASPVLTWTGSLAPGAAAVITYSVTVKNPDTGDKLLINSVSSAAAGSTCPPGSVAAGCQVTVPVLTPALTITKTASAATATPGGTVTYTITVADTGQTPYAGAAVTDPLGGVLDDATYNNAAATAGTVTFTSPMLSWTGNLTPGAVAVITYTVTVNNPDTGDHVLASTVTSATSGSNCPAGSTSPACTATVTVTQLTIDTTFSAATVTPGAVLRLTTTLTNTGQTSYTGISITFNAPDLAANATGNGDQTASSGNLSVGTAGAVWTGDIPVGGTVTITGTLTIDNPDTGNQIISLTDISTAPGNNCLPGSTDPACSPSIPVLTPALTIVKTASTSTAVPGQVIGYTLTVTNTGQTPYTGATVTDSLAQMADDAVYDGDAAASAGSLSYTAPMLTWTGDLSPGASAVITYTVTADNPDTGDKLVINSVSSTAAGSTCPPGAITAACRVTVSVLTPALTITTAAAPATATPGATVTYTLTVTDTGQTPYTGATLTDPLTGVLDDAAYNNDAAATAGTVTYASTVLTWTGNLTPGATAVITYTVTVNNPDTGNGILTATVTSTATGSNCPAGGTDPRCITTTDIATLTIVNTANVSTTTPGSVVDYTLTITNTGQTTYTAATVTDPLTGVTDDAVAFGDDAATTAGSVSYISPNLTWTGTLAPGAAAVITFSVTVDNPDTGDKTLTSTVTSAAAGNNCPAGGTDPRCTATVTVLVPGLSIVQAANAAVAVPGQAVGYTVTVADTGQTSYTGAAVSIPLAGMLGDAAYNGDAAATAGSVSYASPVLTWTGDLTPGQTATITFTVTVDNPDTGSKDLLGAVSSAVAGSSCPPGSTTAGCVTSVVVLTPALTITTAATPATATPGGVITYTLTVTDTGQTPYTAAAVTDPLSDVLDDAAYNNNAAATAGTVTYASPALTWTGTLNPGDTATITFSVTVNSPDTDNHILTSTVTSTAAGNNCPVGSTDPRCTTTVPVSDLVIDFTASATTVTPGGTLTYTATITNTGQTPYYGISVSTDTVALAANTTSNGNTTTSSGALSIGATGAVWTGDIPVGGTVTITSPVTVDNPVTSDLLTATAVSTAPGNNCPPGSTDPRCTPVTQVLFPALTITKTATASTTTPGSTVSYTITVTDTGPTPYTAASVNDALDGVLPDAAYNNDATATTGTLTFISPDLIWTGNLTPGQTATITYTVTITNPDTGDKHLINIATSDDAGSNCPTGTTNPACIATVTDLIPALTITTAAAPATAAPGGVVTYTLTVTDTGQTPYTGASVTDPLTGVLDDAAYNNDATATAGSVSYASPVLTWTGTLTPGATAVITYTVTVNNPDTGNGILTSTVTSTAVGSNCPVGGTDPRCGTTTDVSTLTIVNTASVSTTTPGSVVAYTLTITNTGQATYTGATVTDPLTGILDDAAYNADADTTAGSVTFASPSLTWTGTLAPGAAAIITFTVTVDNPDTGDKALTSTLTSAAAGNNCPAAGTDPRCTSTVTVLIPALTITKTATVSTTTPGSTVSYTITVTDTGPTPYTAASVNDALDGVLPDATYDNNATATTGTLTFISPDLIWTGNLTPGQTATITYTVTISNPDTGDKHLINIATSDDAGSNCPTGTTNPACIATVIDLIPALTVTKTANVSTATPGSAVGYTITVADTGQTPYIAAQVTDSLSGVLGDAAYNNDATASAGTVSYTSPALTWTGDLTPGQTATIGYSVTVSNPDPGSRFLSNSVVSTAPGSTCPSGTSPGCTVTVAVVAGGLSITTPAGVGLGSAAPGGTISANLGTVQVTDNRGFGASWTATVATSAFSTGTGIPVETIPAGNGTYDISALSQATGSATFTFAPATTLSTTPQAVVSATNVAGNTTATWNPLISVSVPSTIIAGPYTGTITHSVS